MSIRKDLEARFGIPFDELMREYAARGVSRSEAGRQLGVNPNSLRQVLLRGHDPFMPQDAAMRYLRQHGESLASAAAKLASTHTLHQAADVLGVNGATLQRALDARGITITFKTRYGAGRKPRPKSDRWSQYQAFGEKGSLRELAEKFAKVPLRTVKDRVHDKGWTIEKALSTPNIEHQNRAANVAAIKAAESRDYERRQCLRGSY